MSRALGQAALGGVLLTAGAGHLTTQRQEFLERKDGFGLDTDNKRALRLLGRPVLVAWALAATRDRPSA
ncbi:hypothetical protein KOI35_32630 [Actinoplanes bogorensis]|uniref:Uncharacterized protein n=2 Tax=Paractinoplanes bogorensis TaxID=1610840 RepID=A0ABS5YZZ0_9ACTN|nr:hypothetical protein [Actinoplanes bogorensis]